MTEPKDIVEHIDKIEGSHTYQSGIKGAVDEAGKALTTVGQAVNAVLLPVRGLIWGADQIADWMNSTISGKLKDVPPEKIVAPNPHVAGPAIEALKFTAQEEDLREMFAELLANSVHADKASQVHPAFVDLIKSMSSNDARLLKELHRRSPEAIIDIAVKSKDRPGHSYVVRNVSLLGAYAGFSDPMASVSVIDNLERMGLLVVIKHTHLAEEENYTKIKEFPAVKSIIENSTRQEGSSIHIDKGAVEITSFGKIFVSSCIA